MLVNILKEKSKKEILFYISLGIIFVILMVFVYEKINMKSDAYVKTDVRSFPKVSNNDRPNSLTVDFKNYVNKEEKDYEKLLNSPITPINQIGKEVTLGVSISPPIAGKWKWINESRLQFTPKEEWPAKQAFIVRFDKSLLDKNSLPLASTADISWTTPEFEASIYRINLEQDIAGTKEHNIFATMYFTHAVDKTSLAQNLKLYDKANSEEIPYTLTYEKDLKTVYLRSNVISINDEERYIHLNLGSDVKTIQGKTKVKQSEDEKILIPDKYSFLRVHNINYRIITNKDGEPEQILHVSFTDAIEKSEFIKHFDKKIEQYKSDKNIYPSKYKKVEILENELDSSKDYFIKTEVPFRGHFIAKFTKGMKSVNGFELRRDIVEKESIPSYPKELNIMGKGSLLALSGDKKLSFSVRGVSGLKVSVQKLMDDQINHLISQTYGDITSPNFRSYQFSADNISEKTLTKTITLAKTHPKDQNYASLDLSKYLKNQGSGIFFIKAQGWDVKNNRNLYMSDSRMVVVTDMGIIVKKNSDGSKKVFVESIHSGKAVANASVKVLGKNGQPILTKNTDTKGHVSFYNLNSFTGPQAPTVIVVSKGNDISFIPYSGYSRQINYSRFDVGGISKNSYGEQNKLSAFTFSDRGIYRPGEKVHLGAIVRQGNFDVQSGIFVRAKIYDARRKLVLNNLIKLDKSGFFEVDLPTSLGSPTGRYQYSVYLINKTKYGENETYLGGVNFSVEEFQPDTMKIRASIKPLVLDGWANPDDLKAEVSLSNLFGTAAQDRIVKARVEIYPSNFSFAKYSGYSFKDPLVSSKIRRHESLKFKDMKTDKLGLAKYEIKMPEFESGSYEVKFFAEGFEPDGGRSVSAKSSILVSPLKYMVGAKTDGSLYYLKKAQDRSVNFIAINKKLEHISLKDLSSELILNKRVSVLTKQRNGAYRYETVIKKEKVKESAFSISKKGIKVKLDTSKGGNYTLNILDESKKIISSVDYNVVSKGNMTGAIEKNAELSLKLNKQQYDDGEMIEMNIVAPYLGTGLITIENDKVVAHKWFKTTNKSTIEHIVVPKGLEGNAYVNVTFVRSIDSKEIFTSPLSYAVKPFKVNSSKRQIDIKLDTPSLVKPGDKLSIKYSADRKSKIVVYAVDEGILQVANYKLPKPLKHFLKKTALGVETFQILDLVLPEYSRYVELAGVGGGSMESRKAIGANLNPFQRTLDIPAVYWSGIVDADKSTKELSFVVPDSFSGSLKVMAVAVSDEAMGSTSTKTTVRGPFVLSPNVLTVAAPGDEFEVTVGVSNGVKGSGTDAEVSISLELSPNLQVVGETLKKVKISEGDEGKATFRLKALDSLGEGKVTFVATLKDKFLKRSSTLSIRPAQSFETTVKAKYEAVKPLHEIKVERSLYSELSKQTISASTSPFVLATGMTDYLASYPHGCTEQIVSQVFPWVGLSSTEAFSQMKQKSNANAQAVITRLQNRQSGNGGFTLWPNSSYVNKFASLYAMHFLTELRDEAPNVNIPKNLYEGGMDYLRTIAREDAQDFSEVRQRALAIYLLIRNKEVATNYLIDLHDTLSKEHKGWEKDIVSTYIAASYEMLQKKDAAKKLINKFDSSYKNGYTDFQSDMTMNAQYVYLISKHFKYKQLSIEDNIMPLLEPVIAGRLNTISSSYTVLALSAYSKRNTKMYGKDDLEFVTVGKSKIALVKSQVKPFMKAMVPNNTASVGIISKAPIFYQFVQSGFNKDVHTKPLAKGIEVFKEYLDDNGTEVKEATQGQELTVRLRIRSNDKSYIPNVVLIDLLPGGFEVIRDSVPRNLSGWSADYVDVREDRVVYYAQFSNSLTELAYRVKVTAAGKFVIPSASAASMYDPDIHGHTAASKITVKSAQ